jgi:N-acetylmuramoyl-L-alanine amidase
MRRILPLLALVALVVPAAASARGVIDEKTANLDIALRVEARLRAAGVPVVMTRTSDRTVSLAARTGLANARRVDAFVSLHNNWSSTPAATWSEVYYQLRGGGSQTLASAIGSRLSQALRTQDYLKTRRGDHGDYYWQLRETTMPAVIVESAFVSNPHEAWLLATSASWRQGVANAIADGILAYQRTLHAAAMPDLAAGTREEVDALAPPTNGTGNAVNARTVDLSWTSPAIVGTAGIALPIEDLRVYRDGALIGELQPGTTSFEDRWAAPGQTYHYEVRSTTPEVAGVVAESPPLALTVHTPPIVVCLDPGHGGSDPGAIGTY